MQHLMRPGVYDISNADYHNGPGTSKSGLDIVHKSLELFAFIKSPEAPPRESTAAQAFGTAYHAIVLEPELFYKTYTRGISMADVPEAIDDKETLVTMIQQLNAKRLPKLPASGSKDEVVDRLLLGFKEQGMEVHDTTRAVLLLLKGAELKGEVEKLNAGRQGMLSVTGSRHELAALLRANGVKVTLWSDVYAEWIANNSHRTVLSADDWTTLHAMRDKLMQHPAARALLRKPGKSEESFYWVDMETGELLRCRPDFLTDCGLCVDLKTARDASPTGFVSSVQNYRYDVQDPFYIDGINAAIEQGQIKRNKARAFVFVAQEQTPPYMVGVYRLDAEDAELGRMEYRTDLRKLATARQSGKWAGYGDEIQQLSLKAWHRQETALATAAVN